MPRAGRGLALALALAVLAACGSTPKVEPGQYRVVRGDTLTKIARQHGQSVSALMRMNNLSDPNRIEVGQVLRVRPAATAGAAGTAPPAPAASAGTSAAVAGRRVGPAPARSISMVWPAEGRLVRGFNGTSSRGLVIANSAGTPVRAAAAGTVAYVGNGLRGYGNMVIVRHDSAYLSVYAHNRSISVKEGQRVTSGQTIAQMGDSDAPAVQLYFEVRYDGKSVDPIRFLPKR
ncbi:peptidoglycan DD-metalloendopeptidase family protein [Orrella sp. JC864]